MGAGFSISVVDLVMRSSKASHTASASFILACMSISTGRPCCKAHRRLATASGVVSVYTVQSVVGIFEERYEGVMVGGGS